GKQHAREERQLERCATWVAGVERERRCTKLARRHHVERRSVHRREGLRQALIEAALALRGDGIGKAGMVPGDAVGQNSSYGRLEARENFRRVLGTGRGVIDTPRLGVLQVSFVAVRAMNVCLKLP